MSRRFEAGQALVEFIVILPVLLLIMVATIGFGHAIFTRMIVVQAANRAARLGAVLYGDHTVSQGEAYARTKSAALAALTAGLSGSDRNVLITTAGDDVHVTVRYRTKVVVPFLQAWLGDTDQVEYEAVYRIERDMP